MSIWIGYDPHETAAYAVARSSVMGHLSVPIPVRGILLDDLKRQGLYYRPTEYRKCANGHVQIWDVISDAPCATEFSISRFLTPVIAKQLMRGQPAGWALFIDCDFMARANFFELFEQADPRYAVMCVKHKHEPVNGTKMLGQAQTRYPRKNWTSCLLFNVAHPANDALTVEMVNTLPGRDLHRLCWLKDDEIGELGTEWNYLIGHSTCEQEPKALHFTEGTPDMQGYENVPYADDWREALAAWAR